MCALNSMEIHQFLKVRSGVKQGCVLALTLFAIYFAALLQRVVDRNEDGIYLRTRFNGSLFNLKRLKSKRLMTGVLIRELLFADDALITAHNEIELQRLADRLAGAEDLFGWTISANEVIGQ